jgi:hypothetical protein
MDSGKFIRRIMVLLLVLAWNLPGRALSADPQLSITRTQDTGIVSWPGPATEWVLESARHLEMPVLWSPISSEFYRSNASSRYVEVPGAEGGRFYRLRRLVPVPGRSGSWRLASAARNPR